MNPGATPSLLVLDHDRAAPRSARASGSTVRDSEYEGKEERVEIDVTPRVLQHTTMAESGVTAPLRSGYGK
jgi:hypothetical protein